MGEMQIAGDIKTAKRELKKARTVLQIDELKCRKCVIRRLGFATSSDVIEMKGRVACEISRILGHRHASNWVPTLFESA
ncbi:exosome RNA helicase MTR4-like [Carassius auratus]|uniref:Exosome RNA helicase MTR4-like n=1 Tax=Carassius auratus TaxID=7957 RepID=A0A6P6KSF2_CARAU|nr:exosome RNA helicase MTR4-like [Carassius auratus]XP_026075213.1 exosome RNA helicase MTR4-like [Carassius auratus]